jgi:hypothetical protein
MAGSTGVLACWACITAGGALAPGATGPFGGMGSTLIGDEPIEEPPQPLANAPTNIKLIAVPRWR